MGFIDDWSFVKTAQVFEQTGHVVYNGWSGPMLGWQVFWGALFIHLFGFSFMVVKLSTLPIAIATIFVFYLVELRFGITPRDAVIGALTVGLSPMFMPLAASFMTDVPSLFVILVCLYCCQRAVAARTHRASIAWLVLAAASSVAGGTVRQIVWLGALVMVPSTAWWLRKRRGILFAAFLVWTGAIAAVLYFMRWYAAQPYSIPESLFQTPVRGLNHPVVTALLYMVGEFLCLLLIVFPVMIAWLPRVRSVRGASAMAFAAILLLWVAIQLLADWNLPWIPYLLVYEFSVPNIAEMSPFHGPFIFPRWACLLFSVLIVAAFLALLGSARAQLHAAGGFLRSLNSPFFWLAAPFSLCYGALLFLHAVHDGGVFDRYALGVMPFAIILLIRLYELRIAPILPRLSMGMLALYALLSIAGTHDWFAWQRARVAAIEKLRAAGIPRTQIQGSFEYDSWTQIDSGGHIYGTGVHVPPGVSQPDYHPAPVASPCRIDYAPLIPALHPAYTVAFPPMPCLARSKYSPVPFRAWMPPFQRSVYIQQFPVPQPATPSSNHIANRN